MLDPYTNTDDYEVVNAIVFDSVGNSCILA